MKLSKNNFYKGVCRFKSPGRIDIEGAVYTYESSNAIYDIAIMDGKKYYQKNMNGYSDSIDDIYSIHRSIEKYYNI